MNKYLFLIACGIFISQIVKAQNGMFLPSSMSASENLYPEKNKADTFVISVPEDFGEVKNKLYFWYSRRHQLLIDKLYGAKMHWVLNHCIPITEVRECDDKSEWRDAKQVFVWEKGMDSLVITKEKFEITKQKEEENWKKIKQKRKEKKAERKRRKNEPVEEIKKPPVEEGFCFFI